ncbi:MAG: hypothetical protein KIT77_03145 [Caldilinea sp.]|nr:hypothetical protein [Caldilinea sp.]
MYSTNYHLIHPHVPERPQPMPTATVTTVTLPDRTDALAVVRTDDAGCWTFRPMYPADAGAPLGQLESVTTAAGHPDALLDACLAFFPETFSHCASLPLVRQAVGDVEHLDLSERLPVGWQALRAEGREVVKGAKVQTARVEVG